MVLDFINIVNNVTDDGKVADAPAKDKGNEDTDGSKTIQYLLNCRKIARIINSNHPSSLGLHPVVYFYSANGRHKIASFFAVTALIQEFEREGFFPKFIQVRESFENLLIRYDYLTQQIVRRYRSAGASYMHIKGFYLSCIEKLQEGKTLEQTIVDIVKEPNFKYMTPFVDDEEASSPDFSREVKSATFIKTALQSTLKCKICRGYIHRNSISINHIKRKQDGGIGNADNAQLTHPYCNTAIKN